MRMSNISDDQGEGNNVGIQYKMRVVQLVAKMNKWKQFFDTVKCTGLPLIEEATSPTSAHTASEIVAVNKRGLVLHILTITFQEHMKLLCFFTETETNLWPTGEIHDKKN